VPRVDPQHPQTPPAVPLPPHPATVMRPPPPQPWNGKTNGFAIASLSLSLMGCAGVLSVAFGVLALVQTKNNGDRRGRRFAIAGLVVTGLWFLGIAVAIGVAVARGPDRDAAGTVKGLTSVPVTDLRPGDCLEYLGLAYQSHVNVVPCAKPHTSEVFARFTLPGGRWAGDAQVKNAAGDGCDSRFQGYSGVRPDEDSYSLLAVPPDKLDWPGERDVLCFADQLTGTATGSLRR
jgi:hypothetical protein